MEADKLLRRVRQLEADGQAAKAVGLLVRELGSTQTFETPSGSLTVVDSARQMAAVQVFGLILGQNG